MTTEVVTPKKQSYKFGKARQNRYLALLRGGSRRTLAADLVGISRETVRQYFNRDPEFAAAVEQAELEANYLVEDSLFKAARDGNVVAMQVWLYNRMPERWQDQRNINVTIEYEKALRETRQAVEVLLSAIQSLPEEQKEQLYTYIENATKPIEGITNPKV